jgi:hypothetical protein
VGIEGIVATFAVGRQHFAGTAGLRGGRTAAMRKAVGRVLSDLAARTRFEADSDSEKSEHKYTYDYENTAHGLTPIGLPVRASRDRERVLAHGERARPVHTCICPVGKMPNHRMGVAPVALAELRG